MHRYVWYALLGLVLFLFFGYWVLDLVNPDAAARVATSAIRSMKLLVLIAVVIVGFLWAMRKAFGSPKKPRGNH